MLGGALTISMARAEAQNLRLAGKKRVEERRTHLEVQGAGAVRIMTMKSTTRLFWTIWC